MVFSSCSMGCLLAPHSNSKIGPVLELGSLKRSSLWHCQYGSRHVFLISLLAAPPNVGPNKIQTENTPLYAQKLKVLAATATRSVRLACPSSPVAGCSRDKHDDTEC